MDNTQSNAQTPPPLVTSTPAVAPIHSSMEVLSTGTTDEELEKELQKIDLKSSIVHVEKFILSLVSLALIFHGVHKLYKELIEIFYVLPYVPEVFEDIGYSDVAFQSLYRKSIIVTTTALVETIYGVAMLARLKHLVHRLHIISGITLLTISFVLTKDTRSLEELDVKHRIPEPPTLHNLWTAESNHERWEMFTSIGRKDEATDLELESTSSSKSH